MCINVYVCIHMCIQIFVYQHIYMYAGHILCIYDKKILKHVCICEYIYACVCICLSHICNVFIYICYLCMLLYMSMYVY